MQISPLVVQLLSFPLGKLMERFIPKSRFFNPGPFNMKEHALITVMANCAYTTAYAIDIITIQKLWYGVDIGQSILQLFDTHAASSLLSPRLTVYIERRLRWWYPPGLDDAGKEDYLCP